MSKCLRYVILFMCFITYSARLTDAAVLATTGKIAGKVTDAKTGEALPFITVQVLSTPYGAVTDVNGDYTINNIPPGVYKVKASAIGYTTVLTENVKVNIDLTTNLNIKLSDVSVQVGTEIVVTAERPLVQKDLTASTSIVGEELINSLPVTEMRDVLQLQAGMTVSGGDLHLRGGRSGQIAYQIDGVPVTDAYDGNNIIDVGTQSIQELQVVSGAFNAEFGQAMSGIVNIVTKDGSNTLTGNVQAYSGSYMSNKNDIFWGINKVRPTTIRDAEGSLSGAIIPDQLFFFVNGRYYYNDGWLYGKRDYLTTDLSRKMPDGSYQASQGGDGSFVSMNPNKRYNAQGKLTYRLGSGIKLSYNYIFDYQNYKDFDMGNRLTPDDNLNRFRTGNTNTLSLNHAISSNSFYTLNLSYFYKDYKHYLFENIYTGDPSRPTLYVDNTLKQDPPYSYTVGGTNTNRFNRNTGTIDLKFDFTSQFTKEIQLQFGGDAKQHRIFYENINLIPMVDAAGIQVTPYNVQIGDIHTTNYDTYLHKPKEYAGYVQTKFEAYSLIFNLGVRFDYFNPDGKVLSDPTDPDIAKPMRPENQAKTLAERETYWYKDATSKYQFSPRLGLAFPISDKGVIHFSYGHFFQLPSYELMYTNPEFELNDVAGDAGLIGNADLKPQKTVKGEIGLQQQIGETISADVTMFFEDFRDLTGTQADQILVFGGSRTYQKYANSDFGFSKGVIVKLSKRFSEGLAVNFDYTYAVTKGNASNPADARNAILGGAAPETFIAPLNWDQTHTLNLIVAYNIERNLGLSMIMNYYSGQPYTPAVNKNAMINANSFSRNSAVKPGIFNIDFRAYKDIPLGNTTLSIFLKVYNLLDLDNARNVFSDTGDPLFTFSLLDAERAHAQPFNVSSLDELYTNPTYFSEPRRVEVGASFNF